MKSIYKCAILAFIIMLASSGQALAQFTGGSSGYSTGYSGQNINNQRAGNDTIVDQVFSFKTLFRGLAHKDTMAIGYAFGASLIVPGLGQAYNGEYWKVPIYMGGLTAGVYFWTYYNKQYQRYKRIHNEATNPDIPYDGPIGASTALYYRDSFRRSRDIAVVATILVYVLQIIDANVFSYMADFEISDDLAMRLEPTVISPLNIDYASAGGIGADSAVGVKIGFSF